MPTLTIAWEYLTGYAVATDPGNRERAEWPPHPARVFMALAAAWFETEPDESADEGDRQKHAEEGEALRWLESLAEPELWLPSGQADGERSLVTSYVPVNDKAGPSTAVLQSASTITRSRQARTFPRCHVGHRPCALHWPSAEHADTHRDALTRITAKVTRIGHSSSLVHMWAVDPSDLDDLEGLEHWLPGDDLAATHCRRIAPGLLDSLPEQTQIPRIERFAAAVWRIEDAKRAQDRAKASGDSAIKKAAKADLAEAQRFYEETCGEKFKASASPPPRLRPRIGLWTGYHRDDGEPSEQAEHGSLFDTDLLILSHAEGPRLPVTASLTAATALRQAIIKHCPEPVPSWISGHAADGSPATETAGHLAVLPLPDVGHLHADGHLLGMAVAFPRHGPGSDRRERGRTLGPLLVDSNGELMTVELHGRFGSWILRKREWSEPRYGLRPETWTSQPDGATTWASVTPVVLNRFPKADRSNPKQRDVWEQEVRAMLAEACAHIGLPTPIHIDIDTTAWHRGSPRAVTKRRRLRGESGAERAGAALGDGFPDYPPKGAKASRPQVHVFLQFAEPVVGPVLIGAGRYRGYGLCKPWKALR